jgi:4-hydroxybenzoate polyprenyltransferase
MQKSQTKPGTPGWLGLLLGTSLFVSLCALAMCLGAERVMTGQRLSIGSPLHALVVGSSLVEYNIHHLVNAPGRNRPNWIAGMIGVALCCIALPGLNWPVLAGAAVLGICSLAYSTPLLPFRYKQRLKDYGLIKIHVLTGVWVAVTTVLPALYHEIPLGRYWLELIIRALLIFPLCIAFDIRDIEVDTKHDIHTLPVVIGLRNAYRAVDLTLLAYGVWALIRCVYRQDPKEMIVYSISGVAALAAIRFAKRNPANPVAYLLLIDGVMLVYGVLQYLI